MQQQLSMAGIIEELMGDETKAMELRQGFAPMYPAYEVVNGIYPQVFADVNENPYQYVLKPQREGGGFNLWGEEIVSTLKRNDRYHRKMGMMSRQELENLILMKRIFPEEHECVHVKMGVSSVYPSLSEIGFYSCVLFDTDKKSMLFAKDVGVLVRTKVSDSLEGGVSAGFAVLDSPIVVTQLIVCLIFVGRFRSCLFMLWKNN